MDRFLQLPLPQRLLVLGIAVAILGAAAYFLLLSPISDGIARQARQYKSLMGEYAKLKEYDSPEFKENLDRERAEAEQKRADYAKMLPPERELPDLISSIKADADATGLVMVRFSPGGGRQGVETGPGYRGLPFSIEVLGTTHQLIAFFQSLAAPSKRIVNVKDLDMRIVPPAQAERTASDVGALRILMERERTRGLTPTERFAKTVLLFAEVAERSVLQARFTAMAYVYTGGSPTAAAPGPGGAK
jgi:Tfp pilus assembly protein PilO